MLIFKNILTKSALSKLAKKIGGTLSYPIITTTCNRKTFILTYTPGTESSESRYPAELSVSTDIDLNSGFIIFKEDFFDKISKLLGLKTEYQTGYDSFDKKFLIKVDNEIFAKKVFDNSDIRQLINWFFLKGFKCLSCCGETIEVTLFPFLLSLKKDPETLREAFQKLSEMSAILIKLDRFIQR